MLHAGAPIDGFGIGTSLTTSSDVPALDCAYKLQEYAGLPRRKRSTGKATWPGRKQVWRRYGPDGRMAGDILSIESDDQTGEPLIQLVMRERPPDRAIADACGKPGARCPRSRAPAGAVAPARTADIVSGSSGGRAGAAWRTRSTAAWPT